MPLSRQQLAFSAPLQAAAAGQVDHGLLAEAMSRLALLSLYREVSLYPKPGLVSPVDSGSHRDMDYRMFLASINSLRGYFRAITIAGVQGCDFAYLQALGIQAEADMMRATHGVNTHRGAIFNLGLLCAAVGARKGHGLTVSPESLSQLIAKNWGAEILASGDTKAYGSYSHGQRAASQYGIHGARHEAVAGFPAAVRHGLPAYQAAYRQTRSREAASVQALFAIMAQLDDTNIVWRAGIDGLQFVKATATDFLAYGGVMDAEWKDRAIAIHREFVANNLSPGGAADLLAVTLFLQALCR